MARYNIALLSLAYAVSTSNGFLVKPIMKIPNQLHAFEKDMDFGGLGKMAAAAALSCAILASPGPAFADGKPS